MKVKLFANKDINFNANHYFEKAKKLKFKIPGINETIDRTKNEIEEFKKKKDEHIAKKEQNKKLEIHKKKEWYDKFRYTTTTSGFLFVIGKDAGTNEVLLKKHLEENDLIFHTEASGSPFGLLKNALKKSDVEIDKRELEECAQFLCCFSSQWKKGFGTADAFWVLPEQVSKKANSGEFMNKGSFMVRGNKNIIKNINLRICLGVQKREIVVGEEKLEIEELFSGSENACKKFCGNRYIKIEPGQDNYKNLTKEIKKRLKINPEDLPKYIPNNCKVLKK